MLPSHPASVLTFPSRTSTRLFPRRHSRLRHTSLRTTSLLDIPFHLLYCFCCVVMCISLCRPFSMSRHRVFLGHLGVFGVHMGTSYWAAFSLCIGAPEYIWTLDMLVAHTCLGMQYEKRIELCLHCEAASCTLNLVPAVESLCLYRHYTDPSLLHFTIIGRDSGLASRMDTDKVGSSVRTWTKSTCHVRSSSIHTKQTPSGCYSCTPQP
jgi:hypothetical protein